MICVFKDNAPVNKSFINSLQWGWSTVKCIILLVSIGSNVSNLTDWPAFTTRYLVFSIKDD